MSGEERSELTGPAWYLDRLRSAARAKGYQPEPWPEDNQESAA